MAVLIWVKFYNLIRLSKSTLDTQKRNESLVISLRFLFYCLHVYFLHLNGVSTFSHYQNLTQVIIFCYLTSALLSLDLNNRLNP